MSVAQHENEVARSAICSLTDITLFQKFINESNTNYVIKDFIVTFSLQRRVGGTSQQRLTPEESEVILVINAGMAQIRDVCVMVDRTKESNHRPSEHDMEPVELEKKVTQTNNGKVSIKNVTD